MIVRISRLLSILSSLARSTLSTLPRRREDGLGTAIAALLGCAPRGVALDEEEF